QEERRLRSEARAAEKIAAREAAAIKRAEERRLRDEARAARSAEERQRRDGAPAPTATPVAVAVAPVIPAPVDGTPPASDQTDKPEDAPADATPVADAA
ncbi:MAG: hypothetical protein O2843_09160, partial [Chloroflexi bacterium]|nr:hypothetical protein [Chloroflexota bacterium]